MLSLTGRGNWCRGFAQPRRQPAVLWLRPTFYDGARVPFQATLCGIPGGQSGAGTGFSSSTCVCVCVCACVRVRARASVTVIPPILSTHLFTYRWCSITFCNWKRRQITQKDERLNEVTYLAHVCQLLNDLNISVLGHNSPIIDLFNTDLCKWNWVVQAHAYVFRCPASRIEKKESLMPEMEVQLASLK